MPRASVAMPMALVGLCACASGPRAVDPLRPRIEVVAELKASGAPCGADHQVAVVRGAVPPGMILVTRGASSALHGRRAGLPVHEELMVRLARRFCADGVSVLRAEEEDGAVVETSFALWRMPNDAQPAEGRFGG